VLTAGTVGQLTLDRGETQDLLFGHREGVGSFRVGLSPLDELILGVTTPVNGCAVTVTGS